MAHPDLDPSDGSWAGAREGLAADLRRVVDRLRTLSQARLAAELPPHGSRATAARETAQVLADAAAGVEQRYSGDEPRWRPLPALPDLSAGDQVAVAGHDLLAATADVAPEQPVWARGRRRTAQQVLTAAATHLGELRGLL